MHKQNKSTLTLSLSNLIRISQPEYQYLGPSYLNRCNLTAKTVQPPVRHRWLPPLPAASGHCHRSFLTTADGGEGRKRDREEVSMTSGPSIFFLSSHLHLAHFYIVTGLPRQQGLTKPTSHVSKNRSQNR